MHNIKTLKNIWDLLPSYYWTGIIGEGIYVVWVWIAFYLQNHWHFDAGNFLFLWLFLVIDWPIDLHNQIYDGLTQWAYDAGNRQYMFSQAFHYLGYLFPAIFFLLLGMIVGKTSDDPQAEARRRMVVIYLIGVSIGIGNCLALFLAFFSAND